MLLRSYGHHQHREGGTMPYTEQKKNLRSRSGSPPWSVIQAPQESADSFSVPYYRWAEDTDFALWELDVLDRSCPVCGRMMHICDHRYRRLHTLEGPVQLICKLN